MKLQEIRKDYEELSGKASDLNRKLIYSGIAIVWLFHLNFDVSTINNNVDVIPETLHLPLLLFCMSLGVELFQLFFSTVVCIYTIVGNVEGVETRVLLRLMNQSGLM